MGDLISHAELVHEALRSFAVEHGVPNRVTSGELAAFHSSLTCSQINRVGRRERRLWVATRGAKHLAEVLDLWAEYERGAWTLRSRKQKGFL